MNKTLANILYVFLILFVIGLCVYIFFWTRTSGAECVQNPIDYIQKTTNNVCYCVGKITLGNG